MKTMTQRPMNLVIFDIDGTLTETVKTDEECFVRSLADVFGFDGIETDWSRYTHTTDSGILREICEARLGRPPSNAEVLRFRGHFVDLLTQAASGAAFSPVAGAPHIIAKLRRSAKHRVSLATGAWSDSARVKMASAGFCFDDHPAASSDDAIDRESIVRLSMQRATDRYGRFESVVCVGDGIWDARACRALGIPFIGIATGARAELLVAEGAVSAVSDFSDGASFLRTIDKVAGAASDPVDGKLSKFF